MSPRRLINMLRSPAGILILFLLGLAVALLLLIRYREEAAKRAPLAGTAGAQAQGERPKPQILESLMRDMIPFRPPRERSATPRPELGSQRKETGTAATRPTISLVAEKAANSAQPVPLSESYLPFGRLIPCELIVTVDSSSIATPIVGLITEDVFHHSRLIIPAGTEVHGEAQLDRTRERIASAGRWNLVWQSGEELTISGLALDRERSPDDSSSWGITDGSAGLRGRLIKSDDLAEIKLFAATLLSGAADALTDKQSTPFGSVTLPSLQNAPLKGAQSVLDRYAQQILTAIERDGLFVRVPAGKQFYLYVTQTVDRAQAKVGGVSRGTAEADAEPSRDQNPALPPVGSPTHPFLNRHPQLP